MKYISFSLMCLFLLSGCNYGTSDGVKKPYLQLQNYLKLKYSFDQQSHSKFLVTKAQDLKKIAENQIESTNKVTNFNIKNDLYNKKENLGFALSENFGVVKNHLKTCEDSSNLIENELKLLGKYQYIQSKNKENTLSIEKSIDIEITTLYGLEYLKKMYETCAGLNFHYMNEFADENFNTQENIYMIRESLLKNFMGLSGMIKVISQDSLKISNKLKQARDNYLLSDAQLQLVQNLAKKTTQSKNAQKEVSMNTVAKNLDGDLQESYNEFQANIDQVFAAKSLLYDPAKADNPVGNSLIVLSNLTWGSIQTSLGLGIILTHAIIISPIKWILKASNPRRYRRSNGTRLKISKNKLQIYADVCGFPTIVKKSSKMSMGIFELDFCAGYSYMSNHEGGHAKQSALLGPLYLPAAILSYAINLGHGGFIESWADDWHA